MHKRVKFEDLFFPRQENIIVLSFAVDLIYVKSIYLCKKYVEIQAERNNCNRNESVGVS